MYYNCKRYVSACKANKLINKEVTLTTSGPPPADMVSPPAEGIFRSRQPLPAAAAAAPSAEGTGSPPSEVTVTVGPDSEFRVSDVNCCPEEKHRLQLPEVLLMLIWYESPRNWRLKRLAMSGSNPVKTDGRNG